MGGERKTRMVRIRDTNGKKEGIKEGKKKEKRIK